MQLDANKKTNFCCVMGVPLHEKNRWLELRARLLRANREEEWER